jgi:hypothetical protein
VADAFPSLGGDWMACLRRIGLACEAAGRTAMLASRWGVDIDKVRRTVVAMAAAKEWHPMRALEAIAFLVESELS